MSKTIWKYVLPRDGQTIKIHEYIVEILHIAAQDGVPTLWAIVDPDYPRDGYTEIVAWGTGWPLPEDVYQECDHWGTCEDGYGYVWHYFAAARFSDRLNADTEYRPWDFEYETISNMPQTSQTITLHCNGNIIDNFVCDKPYDPTVTTGCTGTVSTNAYIDGRNIEFNKLLDMVEKYVEQGMTATNSACR